MKIRINTQGIKESFKVFLKSYIAEVILCIILFALLEFNIHHVFKYDDYIFAYYPMLVIFTYVLNMLLKNKWRILYYISIFTFVPLLFLDLKHSVFTVSYGFGLLLSGFALVACRRCTTNNAFARNFVKTLLDLLFSFIVYNIFSGTVCVIILSVEYIFNLPEFRYYTDIYSFAIVVMFPLVFFFMQMHKPGDQWDMPRFIEIIVNYIICPAIIIYTAILYMYFIKIAVEWELPKGGIAFMVMGYFIVALMGKMLCSISKRHMYDWFFSRYSIISVPPVVLFWIGLIYRVKIYSLTESRVYLLAAGILMCIIMIMLLSKKYGKYRLMLLIASAFIVILTYIPGISAKSIGIMSQKERLYTYIKELSLTDNKGFLISDSIFLRRIAEDSIRREVYYQMQSCYDYLKEQEGREEVEKRYGVCMDLETAKDGPVKYRELYYADNFDTADYPFYIGSPSFRGNGNKEYTLHENGSGLVVKFNNREALIANVQQQLDKLKYSQEEIPSGLFIYQNDSLRIIIGEINVSEGPGRKMEYNRSYGVALFKKSVDRKGNPSTGY